MRKEVISTQSEFVLKGNVGSDVDSNEFVHGEFVCTIEY